MANKENCEVTLDKTMEDLVGGYSIILPSGPSEFLFIDEERVGGYASVRERHIRSRTA